MLSKNIYIVYNSFFYKTIVSIGLIIGIAGILVDSMRGTFEDTGLIKYLSLICICVIYYGTIKNVGKSKYVYMWCVMFAQIILALMLKGLL